jgi:hypothetical protein
MKPRDLTTAMASQVAQYADLKSAAAFSQVNHHWQKVFAQRRVTYDEIKKISKDCISSIIAAYHKVSIDKASALLPNLIREHHWRLDSKASFAYPSGVWDVTENQVVVQYKSFPVKQILRLVDAYNKQYGKIVSCKEPSSSQTFAPLDPDGYEPDNNQEEEKAPGSIRLYFDKIRFCREVLPKLAERFVHQRIRSLASYRFAEQVARQLGLNAHAIKETEELESSILQHAFSLDVEQKITISRDIDVTGKAVQDTNGSYAAHPYKASYLNDPDLKKKDNFFAVFFEGVSKEQYLQLSHVLNSRYGNVTKPWNNLVISFGSAEEKENSSDEEDGKGIDLGGALIWRPLNPGLYFDRSLFVERVLPNLTRKVAAQLEAKEAKQAAEAIDTVAMEDDEPALSIGRKPF